MTRKDNRITLVNVIFFFNAYKNLSKNELNNLSDTARDVFYFVLPFVEKLKLRDFVNLRVVEDRIQDLDSINCGIFQVYFYDNLFNPDKNSKVQSKVKLSKKTTEVLLLLILLNFTFR